MRIEMNSGGLAGMFTIKAFQSDFGKLIKNSESVASSFKVVKQSIYNMNGGVGNLSNAVDDIERRISTEEKKLEALKLIEKQSEKFLVNTNAIDLKVGKAVDKGKRDFYKVNPWAKPPQPPRKKKLYERAGEWLCDKGRKIKEGFVAVRDAVVRFGTSVADTISKGLQSIKKWFIENKDFIKQVAIEVAVGAAVIGLAALTGGASLAFSVAAIGGISAAVGGTVGAVGHVIEHGTLKGIGKSIVGGAAKGFMTGTISAYIGVKADSFASSKVLSKGGKVALDVFSKGSSSVIGDTIHAASDGDGITRKEAFGIAKSAVISMGTAGFKSYKGYNTYVDGKAKQSEAYRLFSNKEFEKSHIDSIKSDAVKNMRDGIPNSIYNAQEALRDLKAFNKYLNNDILKDKFFEDTKKKINKKLIEFAIKPVVVT